MLWAADPFFIESQEKLHYLFPFIFKGLLILTNITLQTMNGISTLVNN